MTTVIEELKEVVGGDDAALYELHRLMKDSDGDLTPALVVEAARKPESPLYKHFEWNDVVAGEKYRLQQARQLIQSYRLSFTDSGGDHDVRYFTNVIVEDRNVYRLTEDVLRIDTLREQRRLKIRQELQRVRDELSIWEQFIPVRDKVGLAIDALDAT